MKAQKERKGKKENRELKRDKMKEKKTLITAHR